MAKKDGEIKCLSCGRGLNRSDLSRDDGRTPSCWKCGSFRLSQLKVETPLKVETSLSRQTGIVGLSLGGSQAIYWYKLQENTDYLLCPKHWSAKERGQHPRVLNSLYERYGCDGDGGSCIGVVVQDPKTLGYVWSWK